MDFALSLTAHSRSLIVLFCAVAYAFFAMSIARELVISHTLPSIEGHISGDPYHYH